MLSARRLSDGQAVLAYFESKANGPFTCLTCGGVVLLKTGRRKISHFAHENPASTHRDGESELHRRCKIEIFEALQSEPAAADVALERPLGRVRPDVSAIIHGARVGIEVQISSLSLEAILNAQSRIIRKGSPFYGFYPGHPSSTASATPHRAGNVGSTRRTLAGSTTGSAV